MSIALASLALCALTLAPAAQAEEVTLNTEDGVPISAEWKSANNAVGALVLLHMYKSDRRSWTRLMNLAPRLGLSVIAIDFRGHGKSRNISGINHGDAVDKRDPELFNKLHMDVAAAVGFLAQKGFKNENIVLVGASVGCSAALDYGSRNTSIRGAILLTPGLGYLGVDSMKHIKKWGGRKLLFVSSKEEMKKGARQLYARMPDRSKSTLLELPETGIHGTRMFGKVKGIEKRLVEWAKIAVTR